MTNMVTRCPQCSTSFRITPTQIQKARGAVRCGSCLHIFKAQEHIVQDTMAAAKSTPTKPKKTINKKTAVPAPQQETLDIPAQPKIKPSQPAAKPRVATVKAKTQPEHTTADPVQQKTKKPSKTTLAFDQSQIDKESSDDDMLISDDMDNDHDDGANDSEIDSFYIEPTRKSQSLFEGKETKPVEDFSDASDESWADDLLEDTPDTNPVANEQPVQSTSIKAPPTTTQTATSSATVDNEIEYIKTSEAPVAPAIQAQRDSEELYGESLNAFDSERSEFILNIDPEPVEMTAADSTPWYQRSRWGTLSVIAIMALIGQVAYLQFDQLSRIQPYRGYYQTACSLLGCNLPILVATQKIQAYNLVVRNHPEQQNALLVDAIIINKAAFNQPFPVLALEFSDIKSRPISSRQFKPSEYLHGELRGAASMPQNQPIHINLALVDPGENAVNYRIYTP